VSLIFRKTVHAVPNLDGSWIYEQITKESAFNPYIGMKLRYLALLRVNGKEITGTAEKIWEYSYNGGEREYVGKHRSTATISGHINKKIFGPDKIVIHLNENGHGRPYSTQHIMQVVNINLLEGRFASTAANQVGICQWIRKTT
jgi:hypothetical protein